MLRLGGYISRLSTVIGSAERFPLYGNPSEMIARGTAHVHHRQLAGLTVLMEYAVDRIKIRR